MLEKEKLVNHRKQAVAIALQVKQVKAKANGRKTSKNKVKEDCRPSLSLALIEAGNYTKPTQCVSVLFERNQSLEVRAVNPVSGQPVRHNY